MTTTAPSSSRLIVMLARNLEMREALKVVGIGWKLMR